MVLGFAVGSERTLAGLRQAFGKATGTTVVPSAFYGRLTPALAKLLRIVLVDVIDKVAKIRGRLGGALAAFQDVVLADSTVIRLHDLLQRSLRRRQPPPLQTFDSRRSRSAALGN